MSQQSKLDQIKADILKNNVCPNLAQSAKQLVIGDGNPDADVMFIGEAPGAKEDEQGVPFVGAAGKFLDEMLASIGMQRADVYITNIVKYRPPNNRDPEPEEKEEFLPYLHKQIAVIQPKLIIPLGRHSMEMFLPGMKISQVHGRAFRKGNKKSRESGVRSQEKDTEGKSLDSRLATLDPAVKTSLVFLPLYHPAAALYNGGMRETLLEDFAKIPRVLELIDNQ